MYRVEPINPYKIQSYLEQNVLHVIHNKYIQNEATLINFRIYQNDAIIFTHWADFCLRAFESLNKVRGRNLGK